MIRLISTIISCFVFFVAIICFANGLAVMSIDFGSEWMKVAIVSPGVPMEIVLNTDSQRKTPVVVAFRDGERLIGDSAANVGTRFPEKTYSHLLDLLAKQSNSSAVQLFRKRFPYHKIVDTKYGINFETSEKEYYSPEELLSMILSKAKYYAEEASKQKINDCVITVPPYFSQAERRSLLHSAYLAKLKVLQLINTNTAFAVNYGAFRRKDFNTTVNNILFYDMGASATTATIASYQLVKTKEGAYTETNPQLTIKGVGFDRNLGGLEMQLRLRDHLAKLFAEQSGKKLDDVTSNNRAMSKLFKEAGRLKKVLSANTEHKAQVENVMDDKDLKSIVSRQEFEDLCADLLGERIYKPIEDAFKASGFTLSEIDNVIIVGGNTRVPKVQQTLQDYLSKELGKSVNADEAAAMGAAYQAAYLSKGFKVKKFIVRDANLYPIQVDFERETEDGYRKTLSRTLFARNNAFPQKKVLTFNKHIKDFDFSVNYGTAPQDLPLNIFNVSLSGIAEALGKHSSDDSKGIKAHFRMDESGILNLDHVEAVFETKVEEDPENVGTIVGEAISKFGNTISKLFGGGDDETEIEKANDTDSTAKNETLSKNETKDSSKQETVDSNNKTVNDSQSSANASTNGTQSEAQQKEIKIKTLKEPIETSIKILDLPPPTDDELKQSKQKLQDLEDREKDKLMRDSAKNSLESFILETRDKLDQVEYSESATEEEKKTLQSELGTTSEWLEYESDAAETKLFNQKLKDLKSITRDLFDRVREHRERPDALNALKNILNISEMFYTGASNVSEDDQIFSEVELNVLKKLIDDTKAWRDQMVDEQNKLSKSDAPKLTLKSIAEKIAALDREVKYLLNKARITPPKKKTTEDKAAKNTNEEEEESNKNKTTEESADENDAKVEVERDDSSEQQEDNGADDGSQQSEQIPISENNEENLRHNEESQSETDAPIHSSDSKKEPLGNEEPHSEL